MGPVAEKVWSLWDDISEMADDLNESINVLKRQRDDGRIPDQMHDKAIVLRARALGVRLYHQTLASARRRPRFRDTLAARREIIREYVDRAGGYQAVSDRTGVTVQHLYANASRGFLNKTRRFEYQKLAEELGYPLPVEIFSRPT